MKGFAEFSEDMQALFPMIQQLLMGMAIVENIRRYPEEKEEYEEGWDYHDPSVTMKAIQEWIKVRNSQGWEKPSRYALREIYESIRSTGNTEGESK